MKNGGYMGGFGSGRPQTRPGAGASLAFSISHPAAALRELRQRRAEGWQQAEAVHLVSWTRGTAGAPAAAALYAVGEDEPGRPWCELRYSADGEHIREHLDLAERPSNLGRGAVCFWRCPCGQLARVLYNPRGRWRCRRCAGVVYESSRASDARVSRILRGVYVDLGDDAAALGLDLSRMGAAQVAGQLRGSFAGLLLGLKVLERLGFGLNKRAPRWHGSMGRPRPRS